MSTVRTNESEQRSADYIQTQQTLYGNDVPLWVDGFAWATRIDRITMTPSPGTTMVAVDDGTVVARGELTDTVASDNATVLYATLPNTIDW